MAEIRVRLKGSGLMVPLSALSKKQRRAVERIVEQDRKWEEALARSLRKSAQPVDDDGRPRVSVLTVGERKRVADLLAQVETIDVTGMMGTAFAQKAYDLASQCCLLIDELIGRYDPTIRELEPLITFLLRVCDAHEEWNYVEGMKMRPEEWLKRGKPTVALAGGLGIPSFHADVRPRRS